MPKPGGLVLSTQQLVATFLQGLRNSSVSLYQAPPKTIQGIEPASWYSPGQPIQPIAPIGAQPRAYSFYAGQNLNITPRWDQQYTAAQLETLSMYPLARVIIENVKDQITRMPWKIQLRAKPGEPKAARIKREAGDQNIKFISELLEYPDSEHDWSSWVRPLLEDMLVIDAGCCFKRFTRQGALAELRVLPGKAIVRYIDEDGYTPQPPSPAYAQNYFGMPWVQFTTKQLLYRPRNIIRREGIASSHLYGFGPVEQAAPWIEVGMARLAWQMLFYAKGSVPDAMMVVPPGIGADKVEEASMVLNSQLSGNMAKRRQILLLQGFQEDGKDQVLFPKLSALSDPFDELIIRWLCFAFGTSPQRLMRMMGTRNASEQQEAAEMEGLLPWVDWLTGFINNIIQRDLGLTEYEVIFATSQESDPIKRAQADKSDVDTGIITRNEAREGRGMDPDGSPEANQLMVTTTTGVVPLAGSVDAAESARELAANPPAPSPVDNDSKAGDKEEEKIDKVSVKTLVKYGRVTIDPSKHTLDSTHAKGKLEKALTKVFQRQRDKAKRKVGELLKSFEDTLLKRHAAEEITPRLLYKEADDPDKVADEIYDFIAAEWEKLPDVAQAALEQAARSGVTKGMVDLGVSDMSSINSANATATKYAEKRGAEMVGMKYGKDGELVQNPDAKWAISDTTREDLRNIVKEAFEKETRMPDLVKKIEDAGSFSQSRADMIARTEVSMAQSKGNYALWDETGLVNEVTWIVSADHDEDDECSDNEDEVVEFGEEFPSGDLTPPAHPNCQCVLMATNIGG